jgi:hypothetical protein
MKTLADTATFPFVTRVALELVEKFHLLSEKTTHKKHENKDNWEQRN